MTQPSLLDLPHDALRCILRLLNVRSLLAAECTCGTLRSLARELPLHPVMTTRARMMRWLEALHVAPRVMSLTARCSMWGRCPFVSSLVSLRRLVVSFGRVNAPVFRHLPASLEHLDLHRLDCEHGDVFDTRRLARLTNLRALTLTFTRHWDVVVLGELPARLERLSIRHAPVLLVRAPLRVARVRLHSVETLVCHHPIHAERLDLECLAGLIPLDEAITPATAPGLRDLRLSCPGRASVPALEHMRALESLALRYDCALLPLRHLAAIATLRSLVLDTRFGVAVSGSHLSLPPGRVAVQASVAGVPLSPEAVRAMFFGRR